MPTLPDCPSINWCAVWPVGGGTKSGEVLSFARRSSDGEQESAWNLLLVDEELFVQVGTRPSGLALTFAKLTLFNFWRV